MKKLIIFLSALTLLAACKSKEKNSITETPENKGNELAVHTHESEQPSTEPQKTTSIIWLDSTYRDMGKLKSGSDIEVTFRFKNAGNNPLVFSNVTAGCGCTVPEKPTEPYAPGKEGKIKAVFSSKGQSIGEHRKTVTVTANTIPDAMVQLVFRVEVTE
jgi:hypothetical protein